MASNISLQIRAALAKDSSELALSEALEAIDDFIQNTDQEDPTILDQLRDELQSLYQDLVDHSSSANVEAFIAILHSFLPIFRPIFVITYWWDLVLRAALRDPRLSASAQQEVKNITLHGLVHDSPKVGEFRKRIMELYLLDADDENMESDVLEQATISIEEQRAQQHWSGNLGDILYQYCIQKPEGFLDEIHASFAVPKRRLKLCMLLNDILKSEHYPVEEIAAHPILDSLLLSLIVDGSSTLFEVEIVMLSALLPQFAIQALDTLIRILPYCYAILSRAMCWKQRWNTADVLEQEVSGSDTSSQSHVSDRESDVTQMPPVRADLGWERLDVTFVPSVSNPSFPLYLFSTLYGLYPCNTLAFLRNPVGYLVSTGLKSPFQGNWPEFVDEDQIRARSRAILRHNILHTSLLVHTAESELEDRNHWSGWTVPRLVNMCTMLDARNAALSLREMPGTLPPSDSHHMAIDSTSHSPAPEDIDEAPDDRAVSGLHDMDFSPGRPRVSTQNTGPPPVSTQNTGPPPVSTQNTGPPRVSTQNTGRPRVSTQNILATYHALKLGIEIDNVDPMPSRLSSTFPSSSAIPTVATDASTKTDSPDGPDDSAPPIGVGEAVPSLQRDNLLLRTELNYELWLKQENIKRLRSLYLERIHVKGAEEERQSLHNKLKEFKIKVQRLEHTLIKEQVGAATMKAQHHEYTTLLQTRLKNERAEKQKWIEEKARLKSEYSNAEAMLTAQGTRLAEATKNVSRLETIIKENAVKVQRLKDFEEKVDQLTKSQRLWDEDVQRFKEQAAYLDELRSRYRNKLLLIESYENTNHDLSLTITALRNRISELEALAARSSKPVPSPEFYEITEDLQTQVSSLTDECEALRKQNHEMADQMESLIVEIEALRISTGPSTLASALMAT